MVFFFKKLAIFLLRQLACLQLKKSPTPIIGVTGSVGKTTCVKAIYEILSTHYQVKRTPKSLNSEIGVPLAILNQKSGFGNPLLWARVFLGAILTLLFDWKKFDYLILEMGVDKPDDMKYLLRFITPQIGVFLNVAPVHTEQFAQFPDPIAAIRAEKLKLIKTLPADGVGIIKEGTQVKTQACLLSFGSGNQAELKIESVRSSTEGLEFDLNYQDQKQRFQLSQVLGKEYAYTVAAAVGVGLVCGISLKTAADTLKNFHLPLSRLSLLPGLRGSYLIDSTYNASRVSMLMALSVLEDYTDQRKVAVLGDMRELGDLTQQEHEVVAQKAVKVADELVLVGPLMREYFLPKAINLSFPQSKIHPFDSAIAAGKFVRDELLKGGEVVLLKGSQNTIFLEEAVKILMKEPERAPELVCRQEPEWLKIKKSKRDVSKRFEA